MSRGKMKGDDSANSKGHLDKKARGSGGTTTKTPRNRTKQDNNKAQNTKANQGG